MKRSINYMRLTIEELFATYIYECSRANQDDAKITKTIIINELISRVKVALEKMEGIEDISSEAVYKEFCQPAEKERRWIN